MPIDTPILLKITSQMTINSATPKKRVSPTTINTHTPKKRTLSTKNNTSPLPKKHFTDNHQHHYPQKASITDQK